MERPESGGHPALNQLLQNNRQFTVHALIGRKPNLLIDPVS
jgi:hypothetical protein